MFFPKARRAGTRLALWVATPLHALHMLFLAGVECELGDMLPSSFWVPLLYIYHRLSTHDVQQKWRIVAMPPSEHLSWNKARPEKLLLHQDERGPDSQSTVPNWRHSTRSIKVVARRFSCSSSWCSQNSCTAEKPLAPSSKRRTWWNEVAKRQMKSVHLSRIDPLCLMQRNCGALLPLWHSMLSLLSKCKHTTITTSCIQSFD